MSFETYNAVLDMVREYVKLVDPDLDFSEGSIPFDLLSPFAYLAYNTMQALKEIQNKLDINTAPYDILSIWAKPRIGDKLSPTNATINIKDEKKDNVNHRSWYLYKDNSILFEMDGEIVLKDGLYIATLQCKTSGNISAAVGDNIRTLEDTSLENMVISTLTQGKEIETDDQYRTRYIRSLTIDSQAGLPAYYEDKISLHPNVGACGINFSESMGYRVVVYFVNPNYLQPSTIERDEVQAYFTSEENGIVPLGQVLDVTQPDGEQAITIEITITSGSLDGDNVFTELETYRRSTIVYKLLKSRTITYTLTCSELRNLCVIKFSDVCSIDTLTMNSSSDSILLNKMIPTFDKITIISKA